MRNAEEILKDGRTYVNHKTNSSRIAILSQPFIDNFFPLGGYFKVTWNPG